MRLITTHKIGAIYLPKLPLILSHNQTHLIAKIPNLIVITKLIVPLLNTSCTTNLFPKK